MIDTAYGVDGSHLWATQSAGFNPMARAGADFRGVPVRIVSGDADTTAPHASHGALWLPKIAPYAPEASALSVSGAHLASAAYSSSDLMTVLDRHIPRP